MFRRFGWFVFRFFRVREHRQKQIFAVFTNKEGIFRFPHRTPAASFRALLLAEHERDPPGAGL